MHVQNLSRDLQAKSIIRFVVKWREFQGNKKKSDNFDLLRNALNWSRTGKNQFFKIYSSRFLDGFEWLLAEATFRTPAHTAKCSFCSQGTTTHAEYKFIHFQANRNYNIILYTKTTLSVFVEHLGVLYEACSPLILPER